MMIRTIALALCFASLLTFAPSASATTYYVRTDGNNANTGTGSGTSQAWATITNAVRDSPILAGDIVYVKSGTYNESVQPNEDGTSGSPIQIIADTDGAIFGSGGNVTVQAPSGSSALDIFGDNYFEFTGFTIVGDGSVNAVWVTTSAGIKLAKCEIYNGGVGVILDGTSPSATVINCLIRDNGGDGIHLSSGTLTVQNTTITGNANALEMDSGTATVTNSIVYNNSSDGLDVNGGTMTHTYNLVYGNVGNNWEGTSSSTGEISVDPLFVSATDFHLTMFSPARNAGTDLSGTVDDDLDGRTRPYDSAYDMGCYEEGPAGHWKLDETSGTTAADSSGLGNDGTVNGTVAWTSAIYGNGLDFDYTNGDDYVDIPNSASLENVQEESYTLAAWFKPRSTPPGSGADFDAVYGILIKAGWHFGLSYNNANQFQMDHYLSGDTWAGTGTWDTSYPPGKFYHVVGVIDRTAGTAKIYIDGALVYTDNFTPGTASSERGTESWRLGIAGPSYSDWKWPSDGAIDDARIYNRALSDMEIKELYGLMGHWEFDEGSGITVADSSGLGNAAAFNAGTPAWISGIYGNGLEFDGTNDVITDSTFDPPEKGTIAFWFRSDGPPASRQRLWGLGGDYEMWQDSDGLVSCDVNSDGLVGGFMTATRLYETSKWYHIAAVYDSDDDSYTIYVDGEVDKTGISTDPLAKQSANDLSFGTRTGSTERFTGALDDFRIYNRELTAIQIAELYGLMGHWKLDETSGTVAADATIFGKDGTYTNGPTLGNCGPYENATSFDGTDDHVDLPDMDIDYSQGFSAAVWMRPTADPNTFYAMFGTGNAIDDNEIWFGYVGNFLELYVSDTTDGSASHVLLDNSAAVLNQWQHCVVTVDASGNGKLYRNGVETASGFVSLPANLTRTGNFIGKSVYNDEFPGTLDDVRIYNRPLTARQVAELYGLVGHWKLDETSGTLAADSTIFGNDGTYTGGVTLDQSGPVDRSADFDGTNDYVGVADNATLQMDDYFSMTAWIKPHSSTNVDRMIINKEGEYEVAIATDNELKWGLTNTDPGWSWHSTGHFVTNDIWTHIAVTYNNATIKTYADGVLVDTYVGSGSIGDNYTTLNELRIGGRENNPTGKYFDGRLDDVRVYDRSLCPDEVQDLFNAGTIPGVRIIKWVEVE